MLDFLQLWWLVLLSSNSKDSYFLNDEYKCLIEPRISLKLKS